MATNDTMRHDEALELLPWLANDSLDAAEGERVRAHAVSCIICRRELAELEALRAAFDTAAPTESPAPDMRRINARIDAQLARESRPRELLKALRGLFGSPWRIAFAAQTVALVVIAGLWLRPEAPEPEFRTLTAIDALPAGQHYARVVFDPTVGERDVAALLAAYGLDVVAGPSERGVVTLRFIDEANDAERDAIIERMRNDARVLFAEPVGSGN